jgi:hypothetical protein
MCLDVVQSSVAPKTTMIILIGGCCTHFAFGATITGFHFILMVVIGAPMRIRKSTNGIVARSASTTSIATHRRQSRIFRGSR